MANAGIDETGGPILDVREEDYDRMFGVNAKGAFNLRLRAFGTSARKAELMTPRKDETGESFFT